MGTAPRPHHHPRGALRSPCPLPSSTLQSHRYVSRFVLRWVSGTARHFFSPPCFHSYHPPFKKKWRALPSSSSVASPLAVAASSSGWGAGHTLCSRSCPPPSGLLCVRLLGCFAPHPRLRGIRLDYIYFLMLRIRLSHCRAIAATRLVGARGYNTNVWRIEHHTFVGANAPSKSFL